MDANPTFSLRCRISAPRFQLPLQIARSFSELPRMKGAGKASAIFAEQARSRSGEGLHSRASARQRRNRDRRLRPGRSTRIISLNAWDAVVEEHETELARDRIETGVGKRNRLGFSVSPCDQVGAPLRHRQHVWIGIETGDVPAGRRARTLRAPMRRCRKRRRDRLALVRPARHPDDRSPVGEQRRERTVVVDFRRRANFWMTFMADLPASVDVSRVWYL